MPNPNAPQPGTLIIDVSALASFLVDLPPGATQGMRTMQDGWDDVVAEINANQVVYGEDAGITAKEFARLQTLNDQYAQVVAFLPAAEKLLEILEESKASIDDERQRLASAFGQSVETRVKTNGAKGVLLAKYAKTRTYRSAIAVKAAKTRRKNAATGKAKPKPADGKGDGEGKPTP